jgi:hypothetical protein
MKRRWAPVGLLLMGVAMVFAQDTALGWNGKTGDSHVYGLRIVFTFFGAEAVYTSKLTERVTEATPDHYVVEMTQSDYKATADGVEGAVNDKDMPKAQVVYALNGDVLECRGDLVNASVYRMANLTAVRRPDKAVKVGDTWTREIKGDPKTGVLAAKATYKIESEEKILERDALVASFEYGETEGIEPAKSTGKVWFAKADGTVLKVEASWASAPLPGMPNAVNGSYTRELVP